MKTRRTFALACSILTVAAGLVRGQVLADRVPADAVLYVGWAGANSVGAEYDNTHLKAILSESRIRDVFGPYLDQLEAQVVKREPSAREPFRVLRTLGAPFWKYPSALALMAVDEPAPGTPPVRLLVITQAGPDAAKLGDEWKKLIDQMPKGRNGPDMTPTATVSDDIVTLAIGYAGDAPAAPSGSNALASAPTFASAVKQFAVAKPMFISFVNIEGAVAAIEKGVAKQAEGNPDVPAAQIKAFLDASGLRGVKSFSRSAGFDGKDWITTDFVDAAQRTGILSAWPDGPMDAALLGAIPADASFYASFRLDAGKFVRETQSTLGKTDPQALKYFNIGLGAMQQALGTNVLLNILDPLGSDWAFFNAPRVGSSGLLGMVAVNKPDDPETLRKGLNAASVSVANWISVGISKSNNAPSSATVRSVRTKIGDGDITYLTLPVVAPAWAISDGKLFVGLYPQTVGAAVRSAKKGGPSLAQSEKYQALVKRLNVPAGAATTGSFYDLQTAAGSSDMYTTMLLIMRYAGIADLFGPPLPEPLLPPLDVLADHLTPAGTAQWTDATGFHSKSVVPFPGATALTQQGAIASGGIGSTALGASIMLPALNRARETANRVKSAQNLRQIGQAALLFSNENRGKLPDDLAIMMRAEPITPETFINPRTENGIPADAKDNPDAAIDYASEKGDYIWIGKGLKNTESAETILAYERPESVEGGVNILYADGHVEFSLMSTALEEIEKQKKARGIE